MNPQLLYEDDDYGRIHSLSQFGVLAAIDCKLAEESNDE